MHTLYLTHIDPSVPNIEAYRVIRRALRDLRVDADSPLPRTAAVLADLARQGYSILGVHPDLDLVLGVAVALSEDTHGKIAGKIDLTPTELDALAEHADAPQSDVEAPLAPSEGFTKGIPLPDRPTAAYRRAMVLLAMTNGSAQHAWYAANMLARASGDPSDSMHDVVLTLTDTFPNDDSED